MRCLVTGGAGFIGSHVVEALVARGDVVRVLDDLSSGRPENLAAVGDRLEFLRGDVRESEVCARAVEGADLVFHLAAMPSVPRSIEDPVTSVSVNELGTVSVLAAAEKAGVRRLVYSSSSSVYGDDPRLPKEETQAPRPLSPYASGKLAGEYACRAFSACTRLETVCLRYFNVYGPRQDPRSAYAAAVPAFFSRVLSGKPAVVYGDGLQTRDFTFVGDVARANLLAAGGSLRAGEAVNIACGARTSVLDLLSGIARLAGVAAKAEHHPARPGDVRDSTADVRRAAESLGFRTEIPLAEGLRRTLDFYRRF